MARRWLTRRAIGLHLLALIIVPGCLVACWWQVTVALAGDRLGWLYSVEWPVFACFAAFGWWTLIHDEPGTVGAAALRKAQEQQKADLAAESEQYDAPVRTEAAAAAAEDPEMAAYNAYLAALSRGGRKTWRDPTGSRAAQ